MARKIIFITVILTSILFGIVQYNDPDALLWMSIYGLFALLGLIGFKKGIPKQTFVVLAITLLLWGINQFPPEWEGVMLDEVGMKTLNIELGRESLGLFILSAFSFLMASQSSQ